MKKLNLSQKDLLYSLVIIALMVVIVVLVVHYKLYKKQHFTSNMNDSITLYHLKGCPHCVRLMPVWHKLHKKYGHRVRSFEAHQHPELMKKMNVKSYPTIMKGTHVYKGPRKLEALEKYLLHHK